MSMDNNDDHESKLSILMDMFPAISKSKLQVHLLENNNDLDLTIGLLLKETTISLQLIMNYINCTTCFLSLIAAL